METEFEKIIIEDLKNNNKLLFTAEEVNGIIALATNVLHPVIRYIWPFYIIDYELITGVDYASILNKPELKSVILSLSANQKCYSDLEILFLSIRYLVTFEWKLDVLLLTHMKQCMAVNMQWNAGLIHFARSILERENFKSDHLPYWLRNTSLIYATSLSKELHEQYMKMEIIPIKSVDIQARCFRLGATYIVALDCGLYTYLQDWCRILIQGYRFHQYSVEYGIKIKEPVKTDALLIILIVDIMRNNGNVLDLPAPIMSFEQKNSVIIRELLENQISFLLGHEFGHFIYHNMYKPVDKNIMEIEADDFSMDTLKNLKGNPSVSDLSEQYNQNDIQSEDQFIRKIEAVDILFSFYELYYYICQKKGYLYPGDMSYPELFESICRRRENIHRKLSSEYHSEFLDYINTLIHRIREQIDILLEQGEQKDR